MIAKLRRGLTDAELRVAARWVARTYLEVERGHRDPRALQGVLAAHIYFELEHADRAPGAPPVGVRDVGRAAFQRLTATSGYAVVVVREPDGSWEALTMVLRRQDPGTWQFLEIRRASQYTPTHTAHGSRPR